jgi:hypothetical protein
VFTAVQKPARYVAASQRRSQTVGVRRHARVPASRRVELGMSIFALTIFYDLLNAQSDVWPSALSPAPE